MIIFKVRSISDELFGISENPAAPLSADYKGKERAIELHISRSLHFFAVVGYGSSPLPPPPQITLPK